MSMETGTFKQQETKKKTTQEELESIISTAGDNADILVGLNISDLCLSGKKLEGKKFINCDVRGLNLEPAKDGENKEKITDIRNTDWTDAIFASAGAFTSFEKVNAEKAQFGFTKLLTKRIEENNLRYQQTGQSPSEEESGGYFNFNGKEGNFKNTRWSNIDFGGGSGYEAFFPEADFTSAVFDGCNLNEINFSMAKIDKITITVENPDFLSGMKINIRQIESLIAGLNITNFIEREEFEKALEEMDLAQALYEFLDIITVPAN